MLKTQFQIDLYTCRARLDTELKKQLLGMRAKNRSYPRALPTDSEARAESRLSASLKNSMTFLLAEQEHHSQGCQASTCCRDTQNMGHITFLPLLLFPFQHTPPGSSRNGVEVREVSVIQRASHSGKHLHVHQLLILGRSFL